MKGGRYIYSDEGQPQKGNLLAVQTEDNKGTSNLEEKDISSILNFTPRTDLFIFTSIAYKIFEKQMKQAQFS